MSAQYDERHGGPFDRGLADYYYAREFNPHYYVGDTYTTDMVELEDMTPEEIAAYTAGYRTGEECGMQKY